jgi:hypothetical protein
MFNLDKKLSILLSGAVLFTGLSVVTPAKTVFADTNTSVITQWNYESIEQQNSGEFIYEISIFSGNRNDLYTYKTISNTETTLTSTPTVLNTAKLAKINKDWNSFDSIKLYDNTGKYVCTINIPVFLTNAPFRSSLYNSGIPLEIDGDTQLYDEKRNVYSGNAVNSPFSYDDKGNIIGFIKDDYSTAVKAKLGKALINGNIDLYKQIATASAQYPQIKLFNSQANYKSNAELYGNN